jgi:hypothetical protein
MHVTDLVSPISSPYGDEVELGSHKGTLDGDLHFLGQLGAKADMAVLISNGDNSLESGPLSGLSLLLDGDDLDDLVRKFDLVLGHELINDLGLLDGDGVGVDLLEGLDEVVLHESAELGHRGPFLVVTGTTSASAEAATAASAASASAVASSASAISSEASSTASSLAFSSFSAFSSWGF